MTSIIGSKKHQGMEPNKDTNAICGDGSSHIDGIPSDSTVIAVDNLFVIDTIDGFKFPFDPDEQDKVLLVRQQEVVAENFQQNHPRLLDALDAISNLTKNSGLERGKDCIVAFQEGSNNKYLTLGIFHYETRVALESGHSRNWRLTTMMPSSAMSRTVKPLP
jgi:hypothetical protein